MKELLPKKPVPPKKPWNDSDNHGGYINNDIKRLPTNQLSNPQVYRINLLPRSYDERVKHELHPRGFKTAGKTANYFPTPEANLQTKDGAERL